MAYHSNKYSKFQTGERVIVKENQKEDVITQTFLDLTNDVWTYRLILENRWVNQDEIEKLNFQKSEVNREITQSL